MSAKAVQNPFQTSILPVFVQLLTNRLLHFLSSLGVGPACLTRRANKGRRFVAAEADATRKRGGIVVGQAPAA